MKAKHLIQLKRLKREQFKHIFLAYRLYHHLALSDKFNELKSNVHIDLIMQLLLILIIFRKY